MKASRKRGEHCVVVVYVSVICDRGKGNRRCHDCDISVHQSHCRHYENKERIEFPDQEKATKWNAEVGAGTAEETQAKTRIRVEGQSFSSEAEHLNSKDVHEAQERELEEIGPNLLLNKCVEWAPDKLVKSFNIAV